MQLAIIEIAKNSLNIHNASSSEFNEKFKKHYWALTEWFKGGVYYKRDKGSVTEVQ